MIPLPQHEKSIRKLREKWTEELSYKKHRWEKAETELKELKERRTQTKILR
jgi:hypothetical protein